MGPANTSYDTTFSPIEGHAHSDGGPSWSGQQIVTGVYTARFNLRTICYLIMLHEGSHGEGYTDGGQGEDVPGYGRSRREHSDGTASTGTTFRPPYRATHR